MRLFVAIEAPEPWRQAARRIQHALPEAVRRHARLADPDGMHITLRFIGEVDDLDTPRIEAALQRHLPPIDINLRLGHISTFGPPARTSVVWLGIDGDLDALRDLHRRTNQAVNEALGLDFTERAYTPHLTLARVRNNVRNADRRAIAEAIRTLDPPPPQPFTARQALLVRSRLDNTGPHYETLACIPPSPTTREP